MRNRLMQVHRVLMVPGNEDAKFDSDPLTKEEADENLLGQMYALEQAGYTLARTTEGAFADIMYHYEKSIEIEFDGKMIRRTHRVILWAN